MDVRRNFCPLAIERGEHLRIVQIHSADAGGGAEVMAALLHQEFLRAGHDSWMLVGSKRGDDSRVRPTPRGPRWRGELRLRSIIERLFGLQYYASPSLAGKQWPLKERPDALLVHSMHGSQGYFRIEDLAWLSNWCPTYLYLQDQWLLTGHCAYSLGCERWKTGCGHCPDLAIYPSLERDSTNANWRRKQRVLGKCRLTVGSPARWILDLAKSSPILSRHEQFYIPNAVDFTVFNPEGSAAARAKLGLSTDVPVILFLAQQGTRSTFKDFGTLALAFQRLKALRPEVRLMTVGDEPSAETRAALPADTLYFPYSLDRARIADYYRAADLFCHSTKADVCPLTILEAQACGTPVVGTAVGGVPEIIVEGETGWLVPLQDTKALTATLLSALADRTRLESMGRHATRFAQDFDLPLIASRFLSLFQNVNLQRP